VLVTDFHEEPARGMKVERPGPMEISMSQQPVSVVYETHMRRQQWVEIPTFTECA